MTAALTGEPVSAPKTSKEEKGNQYGNSVQSEQGQILGTALEILSADQEEKLSALKASWIDAGILKRDDFEQSDRAVQCQFIGRFLSLSR